MKKQYLAIASALVLTVGLLPSTTDAKVGSQNLKASYNNIKVLYNGGQVSTTIEPFIVNGTTYIPLRMMADVFNKNIAWNGTTYTINVSDKPDTNYESQLAAKDAQIKTLQDKIDSLNAKIDDLNDELDDADNDNDDVDDDLADLEDYLNDEFSDYDDFEDLDFTVDGDEDEVEVEIAIDVEAYEDEYDDLSKSDLEDLVIDVVEAVWDEFGDDVDVKGTIVDSSDDDDEIYDFEGDPDDEAIYLDDKEIN